MSEQAHDTDNDQEFEPSEQPGPDQDFALDETTEQPRPGQNAAPVEPVSPDQEATPGDPVGQSEPLDISDEPGEPVGQSEPLDTSDAPMPEPEDELEAAALEMNSPSQTLPFAPVQPATRESISASGRVSGSGRATGALVWGSRTDVGNIREHNEDSFLINFPLFAVADGMGGHAAGEVASTITVSSVAQSGVVTADPYALGAAIERANQEVIDAATRGLGRSGMGTTCTAVVIDGNRMAVGHVGDSRAYLLHNGKLLRVTHDHSLVEELVEAGRITPEEARVHPQRSVITRALGSTPDMRADAFTVGVTQGDRVLLCSDGLSSMVTDDVIEEALVSSPAPQQCADRLVDLALEAGGLDNVTVVVIDVTDDGIEHHALRNRIRNIALWLAAAMVVLACLLGGLLIYSDTRWYLSDLDGYVALSHGIPGALGSVDLSELVEVTNIEVADLSQAVEDRLDRGIGFSSEDAARSTLEQYRSSVAKARQERTKTEGSTSAQADSSSEDNSGELTVVRSDSSQADGSGAQASAGSVEANRKSTGAGTNADSDAQER